MSTADDSINNNNGGDADVGTTATTAIDASNTVEPSASDIKFFTLMFKYLPKETSLDWDRLAQEAGLKDASIAKTRCGQIRRKLGWTGDGAGATPRTPSKSANRVTKPRTPGKAAKSKGTKASKSASASALEAAADAVAVVAQTFENDEA